MRKLILLFLLGLAAGVASAQTIVQPYQGGTGLDATGLTGCVYFSNGSPSISPGNCSGGGGGVSSIVAGTNITISPVGGTGTVTINSTGGGGIPGGSNTNLQYNNSGVFGGDTLTSDDGAGNITVGSLLATAGLPGATSGGGLIMTQVSGTPTGASGSAVVYSSPTQLLANINNTGAVNIVLSTADINSTNQVTATHLGTPLPVAQGGTALATGTSGGILGYTASGTLASSGVLTSNVLVKGGGAGATPGNSLATDNGTSLVYTGTGGASAPSFTSTGTTAGFVDFPQGSTSAAVAPCNAATSACWQAPPSVTSYVANIPGTGAQGTMFTTLVGGAYFMHFSGDLAYSAAITIGSGTSIGSTALCSTGNCPVGTYQLSAYMNVTTACSTTGTYSVSVIYTDDTGSKTIVLPLQGLGTTTTYGPSAIASSMALASTSNFAQGSYILHTTGAASINYSTTALACGTGGPMIGKLYLALVPVQ